MEHRAARAIALGLLLLSSAACQPEEIAFSLLDSASGHPVEGALIYATGELTVFRSDVHGGVTLPAGWGADGVTIWAKDHQPLQVDRSGISEPVLLTYDQALVNPGEARLVATGLTRFVVLTAHTARTTTSSRTHWTSVWTRRRSSWPV